LDWCWIKLQKCSIHELINFHYSCFVTATVTVVWG